MDGESIDFTEADPHHVRKSSAETNGQFVRFESTLYPTPRETPAASNLPHEPWSLDYRVEHVHPEQEERWKVLSGELGITLDGERHTLSEGEEMTLPEGVPHEHWNPTKEPARVIWERSPAFNDETWAESLFTLAQHGEVDKNGVPNPLQLAVITNAYPNESVYLSSVPVSVQKVGFSILGAIGRLAGYKAIHTREKVDKTSER